MKLKTPEADDKSEMAGRMYEACDLQMAIEGGHLKTIDDVLAWSKEAVSGLQALMELPAWVINDNSCVDIKASIEHNQGAKAAENVVAQATTHVFMKKEGIRPVDTRKVNIARAVIQQSPPDTRFLVTEDVSFLDLTLPSQDK